MITAKIRGSGGAAFGSAGRQIEFALVVALTRTGGACRDAVQGGLAGHFRLRREAHIRRGIVLSPASKAVPVASIIARDNYIARHEEGGERTPGGKHLAVPTDYVTADGKRVIPAGLRPKAALKKSTIFPVTIETEEGRQLLVIMQRKRRQRRKESKRNRAERLGMKRTSQRKSVVYKARQNAPEGAAPRAASRSRYVLRRDRPKGFRSPPRREDRGLKVLYILARSAELDPRQFFRPIIERTARDRFADEFQKALDQALKPKPSKGAR